MADLPEALAQAIVARLRKAEPELVAVLLCGSFARGAGDGFSDADVIALTAGPPRRPERAWLEPRGGPRPLLVSVGAETLDEFLGEDSEQANWALGFPICEPMRLVWATAEARSRLGQDLAERLPASPPELCDFVELCMKVRRAQALSDTIQLRWAARLLAEYGSALVRPFNAVAPVGTPLEAIAAALSFAYAPAHYREDFTVCAGLSAATDAEVAAAATRFGRELLTWLREQVRDQSFPADDIGSALLDGSLQAFVDR